MRIAELSMVIGALALVLVLVLGWSGRSTTSESVVLLIVEVAVIGDVARLMAE